MKAGSRPITKHRFDAISRGPGQIKVHKIGDESLSWCNDPCSPGIMLHPDLGHHLQEHGSTPMATLHLFKIKLSVIFKTTLNLIFSAKLTLRRQISQFQKHFSIRLESKPHNFLSSFTRGATFPANSAPFILH